MTLREGKTWAAAALLVLVVCGGPAPTPARPPEVSPRVAEFFGKEMVATVNAATRIEIARLRKDPLGDTIKIERVDGLGGVLGGAFRKVLLDPATYDFPAIGESDSKLCPGFEPAAAVRFTRAGKPPVDVILSIKCSEGGMATGPTLPKKLAKGAPYAGWPKFRADMGPGAARVLGLLARAFPNDSTIRAFVAAQQGN